MKSEKPFFSCFLLNIETNFVNTIVTIINPKYAWKTESDESRLFNKDYCNSVSST